MLRFIVYTKACVPSHSLIIEIWQPRRSGVREWSFKYGTVTFHLWTGAEMYMSLSLCTVLVMRYVYCCSFRSNMWTWIMFNKHVETQAGIIISDFPLALTNIFELYRILSSQFFSKTCSHINCCIPSLSPFRALCQSSQPSNGGQPHGQYDFAQRTETWVSPWKENHQSRWFRWTLSAQLLWVNLYSLFLTEQEKIDFL